ncbi:MAG TPA: four-helix bundle copper-binding protein [Kineosporiaceae bacterium]|nr:four-helix bundle copper-binding protein [Kineosporiaceae bacterium]
MTVREMIVTGPAIGPGQYLDLDLDLLTACIESCVECASTCTACADACLAEPEVDQLRACVRRNLDCADLCATTSAVLTRQTATDLGLARVVLEACIVACKRCGAECEQHADRHVHCGVCAQSCRACEAACRQLLEGLRGLVGQPEPVGSTARDDDDIEGPVS